MLEFWQVYYLCIVQGLHDKKTLSASNLDHDLEVGLLLLSSILGWLQQFFPTCESLRVNPLIYAVHFRLSCCYVNLRRENVGLELCDISRPPGGSIRDYAYNGIVCFQTFEPMKAEEIPYHRIPIQRMP